MWRQGPLHGNQADYTLTFSDLAAGTYEDRSEPGVEKSLELDAAPMQPRRNVQLLNYDFLRGSYRSCQLLEAYKFHADVARALQVGV
jgi:hypothetical protein